MGKTLSIEGRATWLLIFMSIWPPGKIDRMGACREARVQNFRSTHMDYSGAGKKVGLASQLCAMAHRP
jgi:hypothetical protein